MREKFEKFPLNILISLVFLAISFFLLKEENLRQKQRILGLKTEINASQNEIFAWEQILLERPNFRDGWIELAVLYLKNGNKEKAKECLEKAKNLDPLNETILNFKKIIENL